MIRKSSLREIVASWLCSWIFSRRSSRMTPTSVSPPSKPFNTNGSERACHQMTVPKQRESDLRRRYNNNVERRKRGEICYQPCTQHDAGILKVMTRDKRKFSQKVENSRYETALERNIYGIWAVGDDMDHSVGRCIFLSPSLPDCETGYRETCAVSHEFQWREEWLMPFPWVDPTNAAGSTTEPCCADIPTLKATSKIIATGRARREILHRVVTCLR